MKRLCRSQKIDDSLTRFRWKVAPPTVKGVSSPLEDIVSATFFAPTWGITLDSIYFGAGTCIYIYKLKYGILKILITHLVTWLQLVLKSFVFNYFDL